MHPVLSLSSVKVSLKILNPQKGGREVEKSKKVPEQLASSIDVLAKILTSGLQIFLERFPSREVNWSKVIESFTMFDLIPDTISLLTL